MNSTIIAAQFERGAGVLRLLPAFVAMRFNQAGGRLHLHPADWFPRGTQAGSVKERWLSSVLDPRGNSGEGLSFVNLSERDGDRVTGGDLNPARCSLPEAIAVLGADLIGPDYLARYGTWPVHAKFFDYNQPLFLHLHLDEASAARIGAAGKPEAYFFPVQLNNHPGALPVTFFGLSPEVTREMFCERLKAWEQGDTHITDLSRAYRLEAGTGWYTPPGVLHAPGSLLTYEVQWNSASGAVFENVLTTSGEIYADSLSRSVPPEHKGDWDAVLDLIDWPINLDPEYRRHYYRPGVPAAAEEGSQGEYQERWIVYGNPYFGAKELVVPPGASAVVKDPLPYGCIVVQGHGRIGPWDAEAPTLLRYGQASADEFFVSASAARAGVPVVNAGSIEPLVILKHFGPGYPNMP
jgi:hypothetical protein